MSLKETAIKQLWNGRTVKSVFSQWRMRTARRRSVHFGHRVAHLSHLLTLKKDSFRHWRHKAIFARTARLRYEGIRVRQAFSVWSERTSKMRYELCTLVQFTVRSLKLSIKYVNRDQTEDLEVRDTFIGGLYVKVLGKCGVWRYVHRWALYRGFREWC